MATNRQPVFLALIAALAASHAIAAETSIESTVGLQFEFDDNIRVTPKNRIELSGWVPRAGVTGTWATRRFRAESTLNLSSEIYDHTSTTYLAPGLAEPEAEDFNSDNQDLSANLAYDWERHTLSLFGQYRRDSTLNTQFLDTGLGGLGEIEGASRVEDLAFRPEWDWQITQRQELVTTLQWLDKDYDSEFYSDYQYSSANIAWSYLLNERLHIQVVPRYSFYESRTRNSVESTTYGLEAGALWAYTEKLYLNVLLGATEVSTEVDGGYYTFDFENFQIVFVEYEKQTSNGFTGNITVDYEEESYNLKFDVFSRYSPSADGGLREDTQARITWKWNPMQRMRINIDTRYGWSKDANSLTDREREYGEVGFRVGYQFARNWWASLRYRFRTQEYKAQDAGAGESNRVVASVSYQLPTDIL